jgi:benzoyl-CoA 2,3-epoxidase subunit B
MATSVARDGWAQSDYIKMADDHWGILLDAAQPSHKISFGAHKGEDAWQEVPGEYRANLRRIIVTQDHTDCRSRRSRH